MPVELPLRDLSSYKSKRLFREGDDQKVLTMLSRNSSQITTKLQMTKSFDLNTMHDCALTSGIILWREHRPARDDAKAKENVLEEERLLSREEEQSHVDDAEDTHESIPRQPILNWGS